MFGTFRDHNFNQNYLCAIGFDGLGDEDFCLIREKVISGIGRVASVLCGKPDKPVLGDGRAHRYADNCFGFVRKKFLSIKVLNPPIVFLIHESVDTCCWGSFFEVISHDLTTNQEAIYPHGS